MNEIFPSVLKICLIACCVIMLVILIRLPLKKAPKVVLNDRKTEEAENIRILLSNPVEDKVCLGLFTTEHVYESYYLLGDEAQDQLKPLLDDLEKAEKPDGFFTKQHYLGINIVYQGLEWQIFSDGSLYHYSSNENGNCKKPWPGRFRCQQ